MKECDVTYENKYIGNSFTSTIFLYICEEWTYKTILKNVFLYIMSITIDVKFR